MSNPKTRATLALNNLIALALGLKFSSLQPKMIPGPEDAAWPAPPRLNVVISSRPRCVRSRLADGNPLRYMIWGKGYLDG